uniref:Uncharacterized protein n=1 Tax=Anguilla anguilla TaxID=7936 RepID=A0A0E9RNS1_ANGAN
MCEERNHSDHGSVSRRNLAVGHQ